MRRRRSEQCGDRDERGHDSPSRDRTRSRKTEDADDSAPVALGDDEGGERTENGEYDERTERADEGHAGTSNRDQAGPGAVDGDRRGDSGGMLPERARRRGHELGRRAADPGH